MTMERGKSALGAFRREHLLALDDTRLRQEKKDMNLQGPQTSISHTLINLRSSPLIILLNHLI